MRIAYLVLCHEDAAHIGRLVRRLVFSAADNAVFIHVDRKSKIHEEIARSVAGIPNVSVIGERYEVFWGGFSVVNATYALLRAAVSNAKFDRYVLLQGADYPIKSNRCIATFFEKNEGIEYVRAVNCATATGRYFYAKARYPLLFDRPNLIKNVWNKIVRILDLKLKPREFSVRGRTYNVYWGCAQFAVTHRCVELFLQYESCAELRRHFANVFPADETFFHTIIYNSELVSNTTYGHAETERDIGNLVDLENLTYFEYPTSVTIFAKDDYARIVALPHLYVRKVRTADSSELLDLLDGRDGVADLSALQRDGWRSQAPGTP